MSARSPSRNVGVLAVLALWSAAGGGAWFAAQSAATEIERRAAIAVERATAQFDWLAPVGADGLQVVLSGTAPDEVARFRAVEAAGAAVDAGRIVDRIAVTAPEAAPPPQFAVELLRNDAGISLIGLVPAGTDRAAIMARLRDAAAPGTVTDLLQEADHPAPPGWDDALDFALIAAETAGRAKISIAPGRLGVTAITDSAAEKAQLEATLRQAKPDDVALLTEISVPRPVIAPFTLRFVIDADGARLDACAADTEAARDRILKAAAEAGIKGDAACPLGLGVPTPDWGDAGVAVIKAVAALGEGGVLLKDADAALTAPASVAQASFDAAVAGLQTSLPDVFTLSSTLERSDAPAPVAPEFAAEHRPDGTVTLRGRLPDARMREAVDSVARARFARVESTLSVDPQVPTGWTVRVIAAVEALADLASGSVIVTPENVRIEGVSGHQDAPEAVAETLSRRLGPGQPYALSIAYDRRLDATLDLPDGELCVDRGNAVLAKAAIGFAPSGTDIEGDMEPTLAALAEALDECGDFRIEVGGHTDAQGSEAFNASLSAGRAQAVLEAMAKAGIATTHLSVRGYGESVPVADNDTDAGRDANRRIEFRLLSPQPAATAEPAPVRTIEAVTEAAATAPEEGAMLPPAQVPPELAADGGANVTGPGWEAVGRTPVQEATSAGAAGPGTTPVADADRTGYTGSDPEVARPHSRPGL